MGIKWDISFYCTQDKPSSISSMYNIKYAVEVNIFNIKTHLVFFLDKYAKLFVILLLLL